LGFNLALKYIGTVRETDTRWLQKRLPISGDEARELLTTGDRAAINRVIKKRGPAQLAPRERSIIMARTRRSRF
jgi:hypothetical protein